jgi:hypothetical protein
LPAPKRQWYKRSVRALLSTPICVLLVLAPVGAVAQTAPQETGTLSVVVNRDGVPVYIDGEPVGESPLPGRWALKPGRHEVEARPAGAAPVRQSVEVVRAGHAEVRLEVAEPVAAAPEPAAPERAVEVVHTGAGFSLATAGYVTAGLGIAAAGAGIAFGLSATGSADDAAALDRQDPNNTRADQEALVDDAERSAFLANLSYGVGAVLVASGVAMILLARDGPLAPRETFVQPTATGGVLGGRF